MLLKTLSVNYRVHLLPMDVVIFFIPANNMSMLGTVYPQQNFVRCSLCGEVLNQSILYWLTLSLTTYFFFMWCDSWHMSLCLPGLGKLILFTLCTAVCLSALLNGGICERKRWNSAFQKCNHIAKTEAVWHLDFYASICRFSLGNLAVNQVIRSQGSCMAC